MVTLCQELCKAHFTDYLLLNFFLYLRNGRPKKDKKFTVPMA